MSRFLYLKFSRPRRVLPTVSTHDSPCRVTHTKAADAFLHSPLATSPTSPPSPPHHFSPNPNLEPSRRSEREELTLTTSTRTPPRHQTSPRLSPTTPLHTSHAPPPCSVRHVFRVRHAAHRQAPRLRGRQRAAAPAAGDRRGLGIPYAFAGIQSSPFFTGRPDAQ